MINKYKIFYTVYILLEKEREVNYIGVLVNNNILHDNSTLLLASIHSLPGTVIFLNKIHIFIR